MDAWGKLHNRTEKAEEHLRAVSARLDNLGQEADDDGWARAAEVIRDAGWLVENAATKLQGLANQDAWA